MMSTAAKLYNKVLLRRLQPLNNLLLPIQCGFRPGRGTAERILAARALMDRCRTRQKSAIMVFVDFLKAFDSVNRELLPQILALYGVPPLLISGFMALYQGTTAQVRLSNGTTSASFPTTTGVLQGDTLAPFLFVTVMDFVLREVFQDSTNALQITSNSPTRIGALAYADDIALISPNLSSPV